MMGRSLMCWGWSCGMLGRERDECLDWVGLKGKTWIHGLGGMTCWQVSQFGSEDFTIRQCIEQTLRVGLGQPRGAKGISCKQWATTCTSLMNLDNLGRRRLTMPPTCIRNDIRDTSRYSRTHHFPRWCAYTRRRASLSGRMPNHLYEQCQK